MLDAYICEIFISFTSPFNFPQEMPLDDDDDGGMTPWVGGGGGGPTPSTSNAPQRSSSVIAEVLPVLPPKPQSAVDITAEDLVPRMTCQNVADLVLLSMVRQKHDP